MPQLKSLILVSAGKLSVARRIYSNDILAISAGKFTPRYQFSIRGVTETLICNGVTAGVRDLFAESDEQFKFFFPSTILIEYNIQYHSNS